MNLDEKLDEALKQTFPASDAFSLAAENGMPGIQRSMRPLLVTEADHANLSLLESPKLQSRLAGATRVPSEAIAGDVVTMNSMVRYRDTASGERGALQIVYPADARSRLPNRCSVLSPEGLALLGASVGDIVEFGASAGRRRFYIEEVVHQPESSLEKHLFVRD